SPQADRGGTRCRREVARSPLAEVEYRDRCRRPVPLGRSARRFCPDRCGTTRRSPWQALLSDEPSPRGENDRDARAPPHSGSAIDAETGQAITSFTLIPGFEWGIAEPTTWEYDRAQEVTGASHDIALSTIYPRHALRVRADGHLDGISREFHAGED